VANNSSNTVSVLDTASNTVTATAAVGTNPAGVGVNPAGTRVYVANQNGNTVSVLDTGSNTVIATVAVGSFPSAFGLFIGGSAALAVAVEYYYAAWDFYFETAFADEIAALDGGAFGGAFRRTGQTFMVWPQSNPSASPTCRFFSTAFAPKSSHFYTPFPTECAIVKTYPEWQFEAIAFYIQLADANGLCSGGTIPLYRLYNNGMGGAPNHRYTTSLAIFNQMVAAGWIFEGNGDTKVFACVPQ
jgi:YVTN family beta-propeller protein